MGTYSIKPAKEEPTTIRVPTDFSSYLNSIIPFKYAVVGRKVLIGNALYHKVDSEHACIMQEVCIYATTLQYLTGSPERIDPLVLCIQIDD
jgi:hypothetical protein